MAIYESSYSLTSPWASMWQNSDADATVLNAMVISKYGEQALDWDPLTVNLEIQNDFHVSPSDETMNKICAMQLVMSSGDFFERIDTFINVCNTIAEGDPFFEVFAPPSTEEIALALAVVAMNRNMLPFSPTIRSFVKKVLVKDGFDTDEFPPIFSCVFDKNPSSGELRSTVSDIILNRTAATENERNIQNMLVSHIGTMMQQFNSLPGLTHVDDAVLEDGILKALGENPEAIAED